MKTNVFPQFWSFSFVGAHAGLLTVSQRSFALSFCGNIPVLFWFNSLLLNYMLVCTFNLKFVFLFLHYFYINEVGSFKNLSIHYPWTLSYCVFGSVCVCACGRACMHVCWSGGTGWYEWLVTVGTHRQSAQSAAGCHLRCNWDSVFPVCFTHNRQVSFRKLQFVKSENCTNMSQPRSGPQTGCHISIIKY